MIEMMTGLPGAGKSYGTLCRIMEVLETTDKYVVTNVALLLDNLNAYYQKRHNEGKPFIDVFARVRLITTAEAREFWRFRGTFTVLPSKSLKKKRKGPLEPLPEQDEDELNTAKVVDLVNAWIVENQGYLPGVFYVIEEAHILFDARSWQTTEGTLTFYNSQHRKYRDDALFVTQFLKLVETRVKGFAENFYVYRNFAGRKVYQFLRMPSRMRELKFPVDPNTPGARSDEERWRPLDLERAACYNTMAGVGVRGAAKPEERNVRGFSLPWWTPIGALVIGGILFMFGSRWFIHKGAATFLKEPAQYVNPSIQNANTQSTAKNEPSKPRSVDRAPDRKAPEPRAEEKPATVVGTLVTPEGRVLVVLSDGRRLRGDSLASVDEDKVTLRNGDVIWKASGSALAPSNQRSERGRGTPVIGNHKVIPSVGVPARASEGASVNPVRRQMPANGQE